MKFFCYFLLLLITSCQKEKATEKLPDIVENTSHDANTIIVALEENVQWGHYQFVANGEHKGLEIDLLRHISKSSDYQFVYKVLPWKRAMAEAKSGKVDILISATASPVRDIDFDYTEKLYEINQVLYYKKNRFPNGVVIKNQAELSSYKIGAITGYNIDELKFQISDPNYRKISDMFKALDKGWIDFAIAYLELDVFNQNNSEQLSYLMIPNHSPLCCHWLIGKKNPKKEAILKELNKHIRLMKKDGTYQKLEQQYINKDLGIAVPHSHLKT